jgi:hypothetical protein
MMRARKWPFSGQSIPLRRIRSGCWFVQTFEGVAVKDADDLASEGAAERWKVSREITRGQYDYLA